MPPTPAVPGESGRLQPGSPGPAWSCGRPPLTVGAGAALTAPTRTGSTCAQVCPGVPSLSRGWGSRAQLPRGAVARLGWGSRPAPSTCAAPCPSCLAVAPSCCRSFGRPAPAVSELILQSPVFPRLRPGSRVLVATASVCIMPARLRPGTLRVNKWSSRAKSVITEQRSSKLCVPTGGFITS